MTIDRRLFAGLALTGALASSGSAFAQSHQGHGNHGASAADSPATTAYKAVNDKMHKDMMVAFTGDADADFVRGMIPHHQGAIDMARVVLAHGKDPELRKLANAIITEQEKEIAFMQAWLKKNGH